ncbi:MAG: hypothetical protein SGILL_005297, partial [Bacillariaceae sp.]
MSPNSPPKKRPCNKDDWGQQAEGPQQNATFQISQSQPDSPFELHSQPSQLSTPNVAACSDTEVTVSLFDLAQRQFGSNFPFDANTKMQFLCEIAKESITSGDLTYLQSSSPDTKSLRRYINLAQSSTSGDGQRSLINTMVHQYLTKKQSEKELLMSSSGRRALNFSEAQTKPPTVPVPAPLMHSDPMVEAEEEKKPPAMLAHEPELPRRKLALAAEYDERRHANLAAAEDFLGPGFLCKGSRQDIKFAPNGWDNL